MLKRLQWNAMVVKILYCIYSAKLGTTIEKYLIQFADDWVVVKIWVILGGEWFVWKFFLLKIINRKLFKEIFAKNDMLNVGSEISPSENFGVDLNGFSGKTV